MTDKQVNATVGILYTVELLGYSYIPETFKVLKKTEKR